ncbi:MAG: pseudouridine synthase [Pseudomonadota bacterium]
MDRFEVHLSVVTLDGTDLVELLSASSGLSRSRVKEVMSAGAVWVERGKRVRRMRRHRASVRPGDSLHLYYHAGVLATPPASAQLIEDRGDYSVWYKPPGVLTHGSKWGDHASMVRAVQRALGGRQTFQLHRLDRAAQGLMIFAHTKQSAAALTKQWRTRQVTKRYAVIVEANATGFEPNQWHRIAEPLDGREAISWFRAVRPPDTDRRLSDTDGEVRDTDGRHPDTDGWTSDTDGEVRNTDGWHPDTDAKVRDTDGEIRDTDGWHPDTKRQWEVRSGEAKRVRMRLAEAFETEPVPSKQNHNGEEKHGALSDRQSYTDARGGSERFFTEPRGWKRRAVAEGASRNVDVHCATGQARSADEEDSLARYERSGWILLEVDILTGRKHQIRRHLAWNGTPVVGDRLYGASDATRDLKLIAIGLRIRCPLDGAFRSYALPTAIAPDWAQAIAGRLNE